MKRKRSRFENWFSFNQHKKRFGANSVAEALASVDIQSLKDTIISGQSITYTYGSSKDVNEHIANLKDEFVGQPELAYHHAKLIVLIRRDYKADDHFSQFKALWESEADFLCQHLNTRWLISACDTFIDHDDDQLLKATLLNASVLINTLKLAESERYLITSEANEINEQRKQSLQTERLALFDGTSGFAVGTDDSLRNMRWRMDDIAKQHKLGGKILLQVFSNVQQHDNLYGRFKQLHSREKTAWW